MTINILLWLSAAGLVLLALGGEGVIRGGVMLKRAFEISPVIIGLFVLSLGTSSPVLAIAVQSALAGLPDAAIGVAVGATLINLLLILGLGALIRPMPSAPKVVLREGGALLVASGALVFLAKQGIVSRRDGVILIAGFVIYAIVAAVTDWRRSAEHAITCAEAERRATRERPTEIAGAFTLFMGALCLLIGAHLTVGAASSLGALWHLPISTLALTAVAFGASLPVLAVTIIAAGRGHTEIAIGHLITASIFNLLGVLGVAALVRPLPVSPAFATADAFVVLGASALLLPLLSATWQLSRLKGAALLLGYISYLGFLAWREGLLHGLPGLS